MKITKTILTLIMSVISITAVCAQDIITKKDGSEIKAKVQEVGQTDVKYKLFGNESGPTYTLSRADVFMIKYENGEKDLFNEKETKSAPQQPTNLNPVQNNTAVQQPVQTPVQTPQQENADPVTRKGYVGIGLGGAFLTEDYTNISSGLMFTINFGYLFTKNLGITSSLFGTNYSLDDRSDASVGMSGLLVGPLVSVEVLPHTIELDFRPTIGFAMGTVSVGGKTENTDGSAFAFGVGGTARWNCSGRISLSANLDYYNGTIDDVDLSSFGISAGVNFRF